MTISTSSHSGLMFARVSGYELWDQIGSGGFSKCVQLLFRLSSCPPAGDADPSRSQSLPRNTSWRKGRRCQARLSHPTEQPCTRTRPGRFRGGYQASQKRSTSPSNHETQQRSGVYGQLIGGPTAQGDGERRTGTVYAAGISSWWRLV